MLRNVARRSAVGCQLEFNLMTSELDRLIILSATIYTSVGHDQKVLRLKLSFVSAPN